MRYAYDQRNLLITHTTYVSGTGWVLQAEYVYDGSSDRLLQVDGNFVANTGAQPITTTYTNDIFGLSQVLVADDGTAQVTNLFGLDLISQDNGSEVRMLLVDGLGSVRMELVDGAVETATTYEPYGQVLVQSGTSGTVYGFTGEQEDAATGLLYLRARFYNPIVSTFMSKDPWSGSIWQPNTLSGWSYANNNPINFKDLSGYAPSNPDPKCNSWPFYLREKCELARDGDRIARKEIYQTTVDFAVAGGLLDSAYAWHAVMMGHYLSARGSDLVINLEGDAGFPNDPGITRATREFRRPRFPNDEPGLIIPLLHDLLENHLKPIAEMAGCNIFGVDGVTIRGDKGHYFSEPTDQPRAYNPGYWAAFGHVIINGTFSAVSEVGNASIDGTGYIIEYDAHYFINDSYKWFPEEGKITPVPFPGGIAWLPHEWADSLQPDLAKEYNFTVQWKESDTIWVSSSFEEFRSLERGGYRQKIYGTIGNR